MFRRADRWAAFRRLGEALTRIAEQAEIRRVRAEDQERRTRLGDIEGQTMRAVAFADRLDSSVLVDVEDPVTVKPGRWPF